MLQSPSVSMNEAARPASAAAHDMIEICEAADPKRLGIGPPREEVRIDSDNLRPLASEHSL